MNDVESEVDLILARASIFTLPSNISDISAQPVAPPWALDGEEACNGAVFQPNY